MNDSQRRLLVGVLAFGAIFILIGINVLDVNPGKLRTTLTFVVCPLLVIASKFLQLGWSELRIKYLEMNGLLVIVAVLLHLMLTDYSSDTSGAFLDYSGYEIIQDILRAEPGVSLWFAKWAGLFVPFLVAPIFAFRFLQSLGVESDRSVVENSPQHRF